MTRNTQLDNAKFLLILLVVLGHTIEMFKGVNTTLAIAYKYIYSFHMPAFALIAGLLTKRVLKVGAEKKMLRTLIIPLIVFTVLYEIPNIVFIGKPSRYTMGLAPFWILWFLLSLFLWRIITPYISRFRYSFALSVSLTLILGYFSQVGYFLSLSRTFYFLPFFLLGYMHSADVLKNRLFSNMKSIIPICILILNFVFFYFIKDIDSRWLLGSHSYKTYDLNSMWSGPVIRLGFLILSLIISVSFIMIVPKSKQRYTTRGANSLYVYLWHGFFIKALSVLKIVELLDRNIPDIAIILILFLLSLVITILCSSDIVKKVTEEYVFSPVSKILLK